MNNNNSSSLQLSNDAENYNPDIEENKNQLKNVSENNN
jgi:hypothetical protein